ncbi:MAG: bacterial Ig-like domain-containing protein [Oscillospiraceae bacterium]|nr:bacterial Ig-like domain-containing protein [Oscillospiraceae bacterium]
MQSQIILLSNVKQDNVAQLVQKEFEMLGITNIKGKRIDADRPSIHKSIAEALADYNVIMVIGGMGEADGNMTVSAVSAAIGFSTVAKDGEVFPEGAEILRNKCGKPSGCAISQGNQCIIMLPGNSDTLQFMLCYRVLKYLAEFTGEQFSIKNLRACGITKSEAEEAVSEVETSGTFVRVFEDGNEIVIQIFAKGDDRKEVFARTNESLKNIIAKIGPAAYAVGAENVGQAFAQELSKKDLKAAIAVEGIQRGEIARAAFTEEYVGNYLGTSQGVSKYDIPEKLLKRHGVNSTWTAAVLAGEVSKNYGSNIGIAITTDPSKNNDGANIAVCMGDNVWTEHITAETREELVAAAGARAVHIARCVVSAYPKLYENSVSLMGAVSGKSKFKTSKSTAGGTKWYSRFVPMKGDSKSELIRKSIFILCVLVFIGCMGYLSTKLFDSVNHRNLAANLQGLLNEEPEFVPSEWDYNPKLYNLYRENSDLIGYIKIDDTNVDFPVVQTEKANDKGKKGQFYLRKDFYGSYSMYGTPFLDYRCKAQTEIQSRNFIVYGHNVYDDGQMFSDLIKYRQLKFYKQHPVIHFDTLYGDADWLVVGVILTNAYEKDGPVWDYNNFIEGDEEETKEFISQVAKRTMVVTGVDYNTGDHYLTLSTCSYDFTDARVVIVARQVREGEDISALDTSKAYYNSNPLMPDKWYKAVSEAQKSESDASFGEAEEIVSDPGEVEEMYINQLPYKTEYIIGESLDTTGLSLAVYRGNDTYEVVTEGFEIYPVGPYYDEGEYEIIVAYGGFEDRFVINVTNGEGSGSTSSDPVQETVVNNLGIFMLPLKTVYAVGEKLDLTGIVVRIYRSDNTYEDVVDDDVILKEGMTISRDPEIPFKKAGIETIRITYAGYTATFDVEVTSGVTVTGIEVILPPTKTVYTVGEKLDTSGMLVRVSKSDGSSTDITEGFTTDVTTLDTAGKKKVTVTYEGKTAVFEVVVNPAPISSAPESEAPSESTPEVLEPPSSGSESGSEGNSGNKKPGSTGNVSTTYGEKSEYYLMSTEDTVKVNGETMTVYDAVCQIVAYEAGTGQPDEHVKAQAVASYTYLMNNGGNVSAGTSTKKLDDQIRRCVAEVIGYAVLDDKSNDFILATYFSESCGQTADAEWVWGYANRNLLSVSSPVDGKTSKTYTISSSDFKSKVKEKAGITLSGDPSGWIEVYSRWGRTDYVNKVDLGGTLYSARKLRETVLGSSKLRSTAFDVRYDSSSDNFVFTMCGYGHGVGMSAVGSIAYAKQGYTWDEILLKYYSNCYIGMKY